jgi:AP endonuclease-1
VPDLIPCSPGSTTGGSTKEEGYTAIAKGINQAHKATSSVVLLLENMAAKPTSNVIGPRFEDLRDIIALVEDKSRVGVCLDTCHAFAAVRRCLQGDAN